MIKKIGIFIIILTLIISMTPINVYATLYDPVIDVSGYDPGKPTQSPELTKISDTIIGLIYYIGIFISVGGLMILGIKYMLGSTEEKAQYKETMMPYVIGAVLLFGGINIVKMIYSIVNKI